MEFKIIKIMAEIIILRLFITLNIFWQINPQNVRQDIIAKKDIIIIVISLPTNKNLAYSIEKTDHNKKSIIETITANISNELYEYDNNISR